MGAPRLLRGMPAALLPCYFLGLLSGLSFTRLGAYLISKGLHLNEPLVYAACFMLGALLFFVLFFLLPLKAYLQFIPGAQLESFYIEFPDVLIKKGSAGRDHLFGAIIVNYVLVGAGISYVTHPILGYLLFRSVPS